MQVKPRCISVAKFSVTCKELGEWSKDGKYDIQVVIVIVCHAIATDGGVGGVLGHGLCLAWIHVSVSVLLGWWSGSHCVWIHPMVCLVVST